MSPADVARDLRHLAYRIRTDECGRESLYFMRAAIEQYADRT
jgi:hypothetical protein